MAGKETSRNVNARAAVELIRSPISNGELMERFKITPAGYADLLKQLYTKRLITEDDLTKRGIRFRLMKPPAKEKPAEQVPVIPPGPVHDDEEFLDTVSLTELLTFKPQEPPQPEAKEADDAPPDGEEEDEAPEKKSKFSLRGMFKKG
jgi:hypothetical protein